MKVLQIFTTLRHKFLSLSRVLSLGLVLSLVALLCWGAPAWAGLTDDRYDGNIFPLYGGNGYLVPARLTLAEALKRDRPTLLILYTDDSRDCKSYTTVISQLDAYYGRASDILPITVDSIADKPTYAPSEPGYYYKGVVPQTILFDTSGKIVLDEAGDLPFEKVDDAYRKVFDLLPRSESVELKRRPINEINTELVP